MPTLSPDLAGRTSFRSRMIAGGKGPVNWTSDLEVSMGTRHSDLSNFVEKLRCGAVPKVHPITPRNMACLDLQPLRSPCDFRFSNQVNEKASIRSPQAD